MAVVTPEFMQMINIPAGNVKPPNNQEKCAVARTGSAEAG
jgi:hypothetical protein